ncbi:MAG: hypothetical protein CR986_08215 [Ignavibacteriae bacterium]|nr:MAG: hypothetical protein CR986_08215 [Ignavibacteriota bacterium]
MSKIFEKTQKGWQPLARQKLQEETEQYFLLQATQLLFGFVKTIKILTINSEINLELQQSNNA